MKSRWIAAAIAVALAAVGSVLVLSYVRGADARAMSGLETVDVLVAAEPIPAGTPAADLPALVATKVLPANAVLPGGVTGLDQLAGEVALVALAPGEQLLGSKFGQPPAPSADAGLVVPPELQQVTVLLELKQALGGQLAAGDTVGVFLSVTDANGVAKTHLAAQKVLVTDVQRAASGDAAGSTGGAFTASSGAAPSGTSTATPSSVTESLLVTLATSGGIAERIVYAAEFGSIWLSDQPLTADEAGTGIIDGTGVFG